MKSPARRDWSAVAERLAVVVPPARLHPAVLEWAGRSPTRTPWAVAFSGGADSVALLLLVWAHWPGRRRRLRALHFDHRLRGAESRADAWFCRRVCAALKIKLTTGRWLAARRDASEADARAARLAFFARHSRVLWLGHQQDDIAESMLMRLARGSGPGGLAAPRPVQPMPGRRVHLRPLLDLKKAELLAALQTAGGGWRDDSTNASGAFFRNRTRHHVLPAWLEAAQRDALAGAARSRALCEEDDAALEAWLAEVDPVGRDGGLDLKKLGGKPRALLRRALHRWLSQERRAGELSRQAFDALLGAVANAKPTRQSLGKSGFAVIRAGALRFVPATGKTRKLRRRAN